MLKGAKKQMIVVRTGDSRFYDEAFFVLRREVDCEKNTQTELLEEANRILLERAFESKSKKRRKYLYLLLFFSGIICGLAIAAFFVLLTRM